MNTSLKGVWKLSATLRSRTVVPKHIRFEEAAASAAPPQPRLLEGMSLLEGGSCSIPYSEHCGGQWEVGTSDDALRACFSVDCAAKGGVPASRLAFDGLFDGERIAGTVRDVQGDVVADFLCTRLFTFWGTPKVKAGEGVPGVVSDS